MTINTHTSSRSSKNPRLSRRIIPHKQSHTQAPAKNESQSCWSAGLLSIGRLLVGGLVLVGLLVGGLLVSGLLLGGLLLGGLLLGGLLRLLLGGLLLGGSACFRSAGCSGQADGVGRLLVSGLLSISGLLVSGLVGGQLAVDRLLVGGLRRSA